jgi:nitrite reductase (NADH) small subunit/3-phenylpropionate/trans-cinnamate dioxygenase ferredoxin subunit
MIPPPGKEFVTVAQVSEIEPGAGKVVRVGRDEIALFNVDGRFFAIDNTCPHAGAPIGVHLFDGRVATCGYHGMRFDVTTGDCPDACGWSVQTYITRVVDDQVQVAVWKD